MNKWGTYLLTFSISLLFVACGKDEDPVAVDLGFDYFPLRIGASIEYEVDSIVFNEFTASTDSFSFRLRETCVDTFTDLEGRLAYRFERAIQKDDTSDFVFQTSFYALTDGVRTERVEHNIRTVIFVYPPTHGQRWDANAFNMKDRQDYEMAEVDRPMSLSAISFDSTVRVVEQNDTDNFVVKRFSESRYAKHVGLIERRFFDIETQFGIDSGLLWIQKVANP